MKEITITFKNDSQATFEVPDEELQEFLDNTYVLMYENIKAMEMVTKSLSKGVVRTRNLDRE